MWLLWCLQVCRISLLRCSMNSLWQQSVVDRLWSDNFTFLILYFCLLLTYTLSRWVDVINPVSRVDSFYKKSANWDTFGRHWLPKIWLCLPCYLATTLDYKWGMEIGLLFASVWRHDLIKIWQRCSMSVQCPYIHTSTIHVKQELHGWWWTVYHMMLPYWTTVW